MQVRKQVFIGAERGVSLSGLIAVLLVAGVVAVLALKVVPSYAEYRTIKDAIVKAKTSGGSVREIQSSFDKHAEINDVSAIRGRDLIISRESGDTEISFAYEKRIPLVGNVTLLIDYAGTTDPAGAVAAKPDAAMVN